MDHLAILVKAVPLGECAKGNVAAIGLVIHQEKATVKVGLTVGNSPELLIANSKSSNLGMGVVCMFGISPEEKETGRKM